MNDLEKRAHDLAVALAVKFVIVKSNDATIDLNEYVDSYTQIYEKILRYLSTTN